MLQYIPYSNLPYSHILLQSMAILSKSVPNVPASLCTALASAVYTLCHLPIKPMIIRILISISHSAGPNIVRMLLIHTLHHFYVIYLSLNLYTLMSILQKNHH
ncbi:CCQ_1a_G0004880.mRNA.1.CDS.1 [Saccharomyces cerevisiae]|nr:CCQ_1a_G0004880.mRNA.1.CDS.1 [Saccharomyces cerevisiae]CAI7161134.1 CCQ_1a_G0004880.mRNA.1.CDS.1 [Saccharomyces cerevisiae]